LVVVARHWLPGGLAQVLEIAHDVRPVIGVGAAVVRDADAVRDAVEACAQLAGDFVACSDDGDLIEDVVTDETRHVVPAAFLRKAVQLLMHAFPAVTSEGGKVGRRRPVEGELLARSELRCGGC